MPRKPTPPPDNPKQSENFIKKAREIEAEESGETFDRTFDKIVRPNKPKPED